MPLVREGWRISLKINNHPQEYYGLEAFQELESLMFAKWKGLWKCTRINVFTSFG